MHRVLGGVFDNHLAEPAFRVTEISYISYFNLAIFYFMAEPKLQGWRLSGQSLVLHNVYTPFGGGALLEVKGVMCMDGLTCPSYLKSDYQIPLGRN